MDNSMKISNNFHIAHHRLHVQIGTTQANECEELSIGSALCRQAHAQIREWDISEDYCWTPYRQQYIVRATRWNIINLWSSTKSYTSKHMLHHYNYYYYYRSEKKSLLKWRNVDGDHMTKNKSLDWSHNGTTHTNIATYYIHTHLTHTYVLHIVKFKIHDSASADVSEKWLHRIKSPHRNYARLSVHFDTKFSNLFDYVKIK